MRCAYRRAATAGYPKEENLLRMLHQPPRLGLLNPLLNTGDFANRKDLLETLEIESGSRTSVTPHQSWATIEIIPPLSAIAKIISKYTAICALLLLF